MLTARYTRPRTIEVTETDPEGPAAGQVQLAPAFTGICGTDLHVFHGDMDARVGTGAVLGHEVSATVVALGEGVAGWQVGDAVTVVPLRWDGTCPACTAGHQHVCHDLDFIGLDSPGALQQRWNVPAHTLLRLPAGMSLRDGALVEPTAVAVHDVRRAGVAAGERVVVVGAGPVGLLIALVARSSGADVRVVEPAAHRRSVAERLGLTTLDPARQDVAAAVTEWTGGAGAEVAFEVSGAAAGVGTAVDVLGVRGRLCLVAIHSAPREVDLFRFFWRELTLVGARLYRREDFERAVELVATGAVPSESIISRVVPLRDAAAAFAALEAGEQVVKVLVDCREEPAGARG